MKTAKEIFDDVMAAAHGDVDAAKAALCDGEYLTGAGYTDYDQEAIENAYAMLNNQ